MDLKSEFIASPGVAIPRYLQSIDRYIKHVHKLTNYIYRHIPVYKVHTQAHRIHDVHKVHTEYIHTHILHPVITLWDK